MNPAIRFYNELSCRSDGMNLLQPRAGVQKRPHALFHSVHHASASEKKKGKYDGLREGVVYRLPKGSTKEFIVIVNGHPIRFGDPHMENHEDDTERRKNFRARHSCDEKSDRTSAGYWACKVWKPGFKAASLPAGVEL